MPKPFDLDKAIAGAPVVTRSGRDVTQFHRFDVANGQPVCGVIDGYLHFFWPNGAYSLAGSEWPLDLFMVPKKRTVWVNLYRTHRDVKADIVHDSLESAQKAAEYMTHYAGTVSGEIEE